MKTEPASSPQVDTPTLSSSFQRTVIPEWMDRPDASVEELRADLQDLINLNRFGGGRRLVWECVRDVIGNHPSQKQWTLLDLATGSADIPRHLVDWARREGIELLVTATDLHPVTLDLARQMSQGYPEIRFESGNLLDLHYPADSYDIVTCSQALHHFNTEQIITALQHLARIACRAVIIGDLRRSRLGYALVWLIVHLSAASRFARHDGPVSIHNGFHEWELKQLAQTAGLRHSRVFRHQILRLAMVWTKPQSP